MPAISFHRAAVALVLLGSIGIARANVIIQNKPIGLDGAFDAFNSIAFQPFDESLGQLDLVIFSASISLTYSVETLTVPAPHGPLRTDVTGMARLELDGLLWPFGFTADCFTSANVVSGQSALFPVLMNLAWQSDGSSDQAGFTAGDVDVNTGTCVPDPINPVHLSDYVATPITAATGLLIDVRSLWQVSSSPGGVVVPATTGGGFATLEYRYTPHGSDSVAVPEPATGLLLGIGLLGLALAGRRPRFD